MIHAGQSISIDSAVRTRAAGWILYDSRCGLCSWAARHAGLLKKLGYRLQPIQDAGHLLHMPEGRDEMMVLTIDNRLLFGVDAYLHILAGLPHTAVLVRFLHRPLVNRITQRVYRWIADHRSRISQLCRLKPERNPSVDENRSEVQTPPPLFR